MKPNVPILLVLAIGGALSLLAYGVTRGWEDDRAKLVYEREALSHAASLRREIGSTIEAVHSIRALYGATKNVERGEFSALDFLRGTVERLDRMDGVDGRGNFPPQACRVTDGLALEDELRSVILPAARGAIGKH